MISQDAMPTSQSQLHAWLLSDAYIVIDVAGQAQLYESGEISSDAEPDLIIVLSDMQPDSVLSLIIDGEEFQLDDPSAYQLAAGELRVDDINIASLDKDISGVVSISVKVEHSDGSISQPEETTFYYG